MAEQDVQVKEVDVIRVYNKKFGEFSVSFSEHMQQLLHAVHEKLETLQQINKDIKRERANIDDEIRQARQNFYDSMSENDSENIGKCREDYEHLSGHVYHQAKNCGELSHSKLMQATEAVNIIEQRTKKTITMFQTYVERGRQYLDKVEQYIDQYKDTHLNT